MARKKLKDKLEELSNLTINGQEKTDYLTNALSDKSNFLVATAARIIAKEELKELIPKLIESFDIFLENPLKSDPSCAAKTAILEALISLESREVELYIKAVRYVQLEPVWGGSEDTAIKLRTTAAYGLVKSNYTGLMNELARLLADKEILARVGAISALRNTNTMIAVPLLRFKALSGDQSLRVLSACFDALLDLEPIESRDFVAEFLFDSSKPIAETAALSLGEARIEDTLPLLIGCLENNFDREFQKTVFTAIAMLRNQKAIDYLFSIVEKDDFDPENAVAALKMFDDGDILDRLEQILS